MHENTGRSVVIIPTYQERENILSLVQDILSLCPETDVMVVDDDSPDGTGSAVSETFRSHPRVTVWIRRGDRGRGSAGIFGFRKAVDAGYSFIGEMDGDHSHRPQDIPRMIARLETADAVIGSRRLPGGGEEVRTLARRVTTLLAGSYLRILLGVRLTDPTSGLRFFRRETLLRILPDLTAKDPFIITEVVFHLRRNRFTVAEVPIFFRNRRHGRSKLRLPTLVKYLFRVILLAGRYAHG